MRSDRNTIFDSQNDSLPRYPARVETRAAACDEYHAEVEKALKNERIQTNQHKRLWLARMRVCVEISAKHGLKPANLFRILYDKNMANLMNYYNEIH